MPQYFKGDDIEKKVYNSGEPVLSGLSSDKDDLYAGSYTCFKLGEIIWDSKLAPLSNAIPRIIFRESFSSLFDTFLVAGSLEGYITVFKQVFGENVDVEFTIPAPGKLQIAIVATDIILDDLVARHIESNEYIFDEIIDYDGDNIAVQTIKGFQSQYALEQMLYEMVPEGIYTEITLTLGV